MTYQSAFSDIIIAISAFFWVLLAWNIFHFQTVCVLRSKVSLLQKAYRLICFLKNPFCQFMSLIGIFNPLTSKVISDSKDSKYYHSKSCFPSDFIFLLCLFLGGFFLLLWLDDILLHYAYAHFCFSVNRSYVFLLMVDLFFKYLNPSHV